MYRIMLVDDEQPILRALQRVLARVPCVHDGRRFALRVDAYDDSATALSQARRAPYDLFLADYRMPGMDGVQFLEAVRVEQPNAVRLILSGYADLNALVGAINRAQILRFMSKPWNDYELSAAIAQALAWREAYLENERLADQMRLARGTMTPQEFEMKRLEEDEPGITKVKWGPDGSVLLDDSA